MVVLGNESQVFLKYQKQTISICFYQGNVFPSKGRVPQRELRIDNKKQWTSSIQMHLHLFVCIEVNLPHSLLDLFSILMMSFPLVRSFFAHLTQFVMFFLCVSYFSWISSSLPKIEFMLYFQCQITFCSCYNLDILTSFGQHDPNASIIFRGMSVLCVQWVMFYPKSCMNICLYQKQYYYCRIKNITIIKASVMCTFLLYMLHFISSSFKS